MNHEFYCRESLFTGDVRPKEFDFAALRMVSIIQYQLSQLCALMLCGRGRIESLVLIQDGERFEFSGSLPTTGFAEAVSKMTYAAELEMHLTCTTSAGDAETSAIMDELDDMADVEKEAWHDIRFECFVSDAGYPEAGRLYRYGVWDGELLHGEVKTA